MQDEQQERQRSQALKRQQEDRTLAVSPAAFLCTPLAGCSATAAVSLVRCRWDRSDPQRHSHVVYNRGSALDVYALRWTQSAADGTSIDEQAAGDQSWSVSLAHIAQPPVLGHIQQLQVLPWTDAHGRQQDLLLLTSDSGFMSLLTFEGDGGGEADASGVGRLRALAHTRIGHPGMGRLQLGAFLRVSTEEGPPAIAVASMEARHPVRSSSSSRKQATATSGSSETKDALEVEPNVALEDAVDWTHGEGGILVYPIRAAQPASTGGDGVAMAVDEGQGAGASTASTTASSSALPELAAPITVPFDGVLTALRFLPPSSSHPDVVRLLLAVIPAAAATGAAGAVRGVRTQFVMVRLDFARGSCVSSPYPMQLDFNEVVLDILVANPRCDAAATAAAGSAASAAAATAPPKACFVLVQLETRVVLFDVDSASTLRFPASVPLPAWADVASDQSMQRAVGAVPLLTSWSWVGDRRLVCVSETGDVHLLHLWWNDADPASMPHESADAAAWMRFVPLGLATPSACMVALSAPAPAAAHATAAASDMLLLPGEGAEGMLLRIDWPCAQHNIRSSVYSNSASAPAPPAAHLSAEPALQRVSYLPNPSPLLDFAVANATLHSAHPSSAAQAYCVGGLGRHGALRVMRPNTVEAEVLEEGDEGGEGEDAGAGSSTSTDQKIFQALLPLRSRHPRTRRSETLALVYSFVGSTRVRAMLNGALDDVSEALAAGGVELNRTTLDAALLDAADGSGSQRVMLQVDDRTVRAVLLQPEGFVGQRLLASWTAPVTADATAAAGSDSTAIFTHAHISDGGDWVLLSVPSSRSAVLLSHRFDPVACASELRVRGQIALGCDVSAVCVATVSSDAMPLCMVATHDCQLHFFQPAPLPPSFSAGAEAPDLLHFHQTDLKALLPADRESDMGGDAQMSSMAESLLLCSSSSLGDFATAQSSSPQPQQHHLFIGLRDGHFIRASLHPHGSGGFVSAAAAAAAGSAAAAAAAVSDESGWLRQCVVRRLGSARVKLVRMDSSDPASSEVVLLALCDRTFVVESPLSCDASRRRQPAVRVRELVWPWGQSTALSTVLQFAAPFIQPDLAESAGASMSTSVGVACVIDGQFHLVDLSLSRAHSSVSRAFPLGGTPRRVLHHGPSNLLCVLTLDHTDLGPQSRLLLVEPLSGAVVHQYDFCEAGKDRTDQVTAHSLCLWQQPSGRTVVLVGGALRKHAAAPSHACLFCFVLETAAIETEAAVTGSSGAVPMDIGDVPSSAAASASSSKSLRHTLVPLCSWSSGTSATRCATSICVQSSKAFLVGTDTHVMLVVLRAEQKDGRTEETLKLAQMSEVSVPVVDMWVLPADARAGQPAVLAITDQRQGVSLATLDRQGKIVVTHTDPCARIARQAIAFSSTAIMQPVHTLPPQQVGNPITLAQDNATSAMVVATGAAATAPPAPVASIVRVIGFDVLGRVFMLRQDPASEAALLRAAKRSALPAHAAVSASSAAGTSAGSAAAPTGASSAAAPRPQQPALAISTSLVQEASFQLGSAPSRVRMHLGNGHSRADRPLFLVSSMLGSLHAVREIDVADAAWLHALQCRLGVHRHTRSLVANHHASHRSFHAHDSMATGMPPLDDAEMLLDGELLASFFTLTLSEQQRICDQLPREGGAVRKATKVAEDLEAMLQVQL